MLERTSEPGQVEKQITDIQGSRGRHGNAMGSAGRLVIIKLIRKKGNRTIAVCKCICGTTKSIPLYHIKSGAVKSCGCLRNETTTITGHKNKKHGQAIPGHRGATYRSWETMKARCLNINNPAYKDYGGRGITVCERWINSFEDFLSDMGERPRNTTIDRIDTNGGYYPNNCRWAKPNVQQRNKRNNRIVVYNKEPITLIELHEKTGVPYQRLFERIVRRKWAVEDAVNKAPRGYY